MSLEKLIEAWPWLRRPGAGDVLMLGDGEGVTLGDALKGASVTGDLLIATARCSE